MSLKSDEFLPKTRCLKCVSESPTSIHIILVMSETVIVQSDKNDGYQDGIQRAFYLQLAKVFYTEYCSKPGLDDLSHMQVFKRSRSEVCSNLGHINVYTDTLVVWKMLEFIFV